MRITPEDHATAGLEAAERRLVKQKKEIKQNWFRTVFRPVELIGGGERDFRKESFEWDLLFLFARVDGILRWGWNGSRSYCVGSLG
jgi:hypothetical protein